MLRDKIGADTSPHFWWIIASILIAWAVGYGLGLETHPFIESLEVSDLQRDLRKEQMKAASNKGIIEAQNQIVDNFCKQYKEINK